MLLTRSKIGPHTAVVPVLKGLIHIYPIYQLDFLAYCYTRVNIITIPVPNTV